MNFQQLRIIGETVKHNFNLTEVAGALNTSQSGVSKHIKDLEEELGVALFERKGKRLLGLTEPGRELLPIVERMLTDTRNIKRIGEQFSQRDEGELRIATTHTQARYVLPAVIAKFRIGFPKVRLVLHQANPIEIATMLLNGSADIGIATETLALEPLLATFPYLRWSHAVIVPKGHPLANGQTMPLQSLTLDAIADYPIVTYDAAFTGRSRIDATFAKAELSPDIVLEALDSDVIKTYVELGLGIGIITSIAYDPVRDAGLTLLDATHLFDSNVSRIAVRRGRTQRDYTYRFIELLAPELTESKVRIGATENSLSQTFTGRA
ncbi:MAG: CysB family HTH-type transcriptional regulator [Hyphomicrobiaceae bacterium]